MAWKYQGCADQLQLPFCQLSKNSGMTAFGVKKLLPFATGPFLQATGKIDAEGTLGLCEEITYRLTG